MYQIFQAVLHNLYIILNVSGGSGYATITLRGDSICVLVASNFTFMVTVFSPSDTKINNPVAVRMITPDSIVSPFCSYCC